ncbi:MAG TPA: DNA-binding domain-containing protein [Burkholderiaceae bacterium]|nr:DNA-binding domain-containing protein [Burkholderiaceae bacterium]
MRASPALAEVQQRVLGALLPQHADASANAPLTDSALALLKSTRGPSTAQRLQIYRHNLFESLAGALGAVYPVLAQLVGDEYFRQLARRFIAQHPLRTGNLHGFGHELAQLLRELPSAAELPYLADVAALEWAWHEVYHEADDDPLDPARLAEVPAARQLGLGLQLVSAARIVESPYPVLRIWRAHQPDADPAAPLSLADGGVRLLVLRRRLEIEFVLLGDGEARWLGLLASGATLADATIAALGRDPAFDLAATLGRHLALGSFGALSFAAMPPAGQEIA